MSTSNEYDNVYSSLSGIGKTFDVQDDKSYHAPFLATASSRRDSAKDPRTRRVLFALFVLVMILLLVIAALCVAFAVEITKLKSALDQQPQNVLSERIQIIENMTQQLSQEFYRSNQQLNITIRQQVMSVLQSTFQQVMQCCSDSESALQQLNGSIGMAIQRFGRNYTALDDRLQQLTAELGMRGQHASFPVDSCTALPPSSPSGYYWVWNSIGSAVRVYCNMTRSCGGVTGGWTRVVELDMTNSSHQCPSGLRERNDNNIRTCGTNPAILCSSVTLPTSALGCSKVCGKIRAYQVGSPDSFGDLGVGGSHRSNDINSNYMDGISLTYGTPRRHIWTFAAALDEVGTHPSENCLCINTNQAHLAVQPPAFVGNDYFCDTAARDRFSTTTFYSSDPLWDGAGCGPLNTCCSFNNPPWFYKQLPQPTTDDIEMRVCRDQPTEDEDTAIDMFEIYVQ